MTDTAIRTRGLTRHFGELVAVNNIDLNVPQGAIYGFLGPNGSGKTTAIRMLCGLLTPTSGEVEVLGMKVPEQSDALRQRIGYMTQNFSLYDDLSVTENMAFMARIFGMSRSDGNERIKQLLDRYNLNSMRDRRASAMSGGQRQRLALAVATLHSPDLLFLDEPTSAVDPENRRDFWEKLFDLADEGKTVLVSTHYMDEAERCHQLAVLETGELRTAGTPNELLAALEQRVVEVSGPGLRQLKDQLLQLPEVISAAQQGMQLRVLLQPDLTGSPTERLASAIARDDISIAVARPSLEDVFVASTTQQEQAA
ncbi:ABC transporter ATP-binding protein [Halioglobus japonicus]|uniref:ABC transporter ATP-binding protein n=1 Tax=Halioglobus japonicus TaxID=930805 RepID=A0AAP8MD13_9GAMM|nr:ABC transporter ATP-binding protein [Halioglobus japonicus]AQA17619.1 ABC transporter ATP-binding protein [Halioglobus japonicus]PLW85558.1 ABC transporter ATP-binding protein [Halioglobus japonicus]GHD16264.1 ABC transporter ATP-binding protein [Halioglobus japonicus]